MLEYRRRITRLHAYIARNGRQPLEGLRRTTMRELLEFNEELTEILIAERESFERSLAEQDG